MNYQAITFALKKGKSPAALPRQQGGGSLMGGATDTHSNSVSVIKEENKYEMHHLRRRRRLNLLETNIGSLPDDILFFDILKRLPAYDINNATMVVCRKWYQMIHTHNFIHTHLHHSTCGFIIQNLDNFSVSFMEMRQDGQIEISKFVYMGRYSHYYWSSCNGLMLECNFKDYNELVVLNPVTKNHILLPPFITRTQPPNSSSAVAHAPSSMVYKVVRTSYLDPKSRKYFCAILTVGIDNSWRLVDTQHLSLSASEHFNSRPLVTGGFVHWAAGGSFVHWAVGSSFVLTLDLETETVSQFPLPRGYGQRFVKYFLYFSTASYLSLLVVRGYFKWDVWEMKPETGEWTKLPDIDLGDQECAFLQLCREQDSSFKADDDDDVGCKLIPVGWSKYREVLLFIVFKVYKVPRAFYHYQTRLRIAYNVRTRDFYWCELEEHHYFPYLVHRNSLEWLNGCCT